MENQENGARLFRQAWIAGVHRHYPGTPKPGYVAPWDETPDWERRAAGAVYEQVAQFVLISNGLTARLSRGQRSRFVAICWIAQVHKHIGEPKSSYVADWDQLPVWQQEANADIFQAIEAALMAKMQNSPGYPAST